LGKAPFSITEIGNYPGHRKEIELNIPKPSGIHSWKIKASTSIRANEPNIAKCFIYLLLIRTRHQVKINIYSFKEF
jgi:hypothetical protein